MTPLLGVKQACVEVSRLTMAFGDFVVQRDLDFGVQPGSIFAIMGGSGCGKSTLLRHMIGLLRPAAGKLRLEGEDLWAISEERRSELLRGSGVLFQGGALWSSMTLAENVGLPLEEVTDITAKEIREVASYKLSLVGLAGFEDYYPAQISGGMCKRAGLARAIALDPKLLFFDEPSAGLDPISSRRLDDLILELRESLGATVVFVSHELASIFAIADDSVFLDAETRTQIARGNPRELLDHCPEPTVRQFLTRGEA
jgi:phospholipid/cholesterol/gamma-HCH transport system ATP-binding protein